MIKDVSVIKPNNRQVKQAVPNWRRLLLGFLVVFLASWLGWDQLPQISDSDPASDTAAYFRGDNYEDLPKGEAIPVDYLSARDGDTIRVELNGHIVNVRYLMIDTPEMNYQEGQPEPWAQEALSLNEELLTQASQVELVLDQGPAVDRYYRVLAYVYADGQSISDILLEEGLAQVRYVNPPNNSQEDHFRQLEAQARQAGLGIWQ